MEQFHYAANWQVKTIAWMMNNATTIVDHQLPRVLKRGMENFTLNTIVDWAQRNGYKNIIGEYLPTLKNGMVANHYANLGFKKIEGTATDRFILDVTNYEPKVCFINGKD